jgi:Bacterial aa3 type cytochrome c oxidase subunit IV
MSEYKHGSMDTTAQEKTFAGFVKAVTWVAMFALGFLVFLAIVDG